jgi:hypothetical protein
MRMLPAIIANLVLVAAALGYGSGLRRLFPQSFSKLDRLAMMLLGGMGILGTVLFVTGLAWFTRTTIGVVLLAGVLTGAAGLRGMLGEWRGGIGEMEWPVLPVGIVCVVLMVTAVGGLALPAGDMNHDAIAYHYLGPKVWLREGVIRPVADEIQTAFPAVIETQFGALMALGEQRAPGFSAVIALAGLLLATGSLGMRLNDS